MHNVNTMGLVCIPLLWDCLLQALIDPVRLYWTIAVRAEVSKPIALCCFRANGLQTSLGRINSTEMVPSWNS
jgi:hypothetical protein